MNEAVVKQEVIEEPCNFAFKTGEYVEVKQEEIERKPENLLEKEIKTEPIDFVENNNAIFEDVPEVSTLKCEICQEIMPRKLLKLITMKEDKTVLSELFKVGGSLETMTTYVCVSHIQTIIDQNGGKVKRSSTPFEKLLLSFIRRNKYLIKAINHENRNAEFVT
ncbi:hypothetical protein B9Z55_021145 [Caenorhabditis nigoni]|uniref:Uncharacterized protein n=1 Tax=Caenorhabditis nigoni TaxID=1611254 RepID=A0A2G5TQV5_9PELO|nr:hypothetical protein B9Z55_021145 [Caenorhabditis nigoni]